MKGKYYYEISKSWRIFRKILKEKNKTKKQFSEEANISLSSINSWISGKSFPKPENIYKLYKHLDIHPEELLKYYK